jgi:type I restriction enzyme S subunit
MQAVLFLGLLNLTHDRFRPLPVPVAPLNEQQRIMDAIEEIFSDLDAGMAVLERLQAKLKVYRASVLKAAVEGALTADWRAKHSHTESADALLTRILAERRRRWEKDQLQKFKDADKEPPANWKMKYQEPVAPDTTKLSALPKGWCWATIEQCSDLIQYGTSAKTNANSEGIPVLRMGNIRTDGTLDLADLKYLPATHDEFPNCM